MFGALLGHLGKARKEIEQDKDLLKKRDSVVTEVDKKDQEEIKKLIQIDQEKQWREKEELDLIEMHRKITHLQLNLTRWIRNERRDVEFIKTKSLPPLLYSPAKHTEETEALIEAAKEELDVKIAEKQKDTQVQVDRCNEEFKAKNIARKEKRKQLIEEESKPVEKIIISKDFSGSENKVSEQTTASKEFDQKSIESKKHALTEKVEESGQKAATGETKSDERKAEQVPVEQKKNEASLRKGRKGKKNTPIEKIIDPKILKVAELRKELKKRDCAVTGLKAELVQRLMDALTSES